MTPQHQQAPDLASIGGFRHTCIDMIDGYSSGTEVSDRWLRVFLAVVAAGSFTGAGRDLGIGQPAVSHAVKQLETALGAAVFSRESGNVVLTDAGRRLAENVRGGFETVDR